MIEFLIFTAVVLFSSCFIVKQQNIAIIERFGKFARTAHPGLNFKIPLIEKVAEESNLRIQQLNLQIETKTKDNVFVGIIVAVQYKIIPSKIYEAYYQLTAPTEQIQAYVFDVVRAKVPNIELDDLFAKKDEIAIDVKNELKETMANFGYEIIQALVTDIEPNKNVKDAMNEINTALRLRIAAQERGEADKIIRIKHAEAEAESNILHGKGIAGQRQAIIDGLSFSMDKIKNSSPSMTTEDVTNIILTIQYFDMLREIGSGSKTNTLFLPHSSDGLSQIRNSLLEALAASNNITGEHGGILNKNNNSINTAVKKDAVESINTKQLTETEDREKKSKKTQSKKHSDLEKVWDE